MLAVLQQTGWVIVENIDNQGAFLELANRLGVPVAPGGRPLIQQLVPVAPHAAPPATYSARFGLDAFPLHTDMANWTTPPRYVVLRNAHMPSAVPTLLLDAFPLLPDELVATLARSAFCTRCGPRGFLCSALSIARGQPRLRWDSVALKPIDDYSADAARAFADILDTAGGKRQVEVDWHRTGTALVIDNWRLLHARPRAEDPSRRLERILVIQSKVRF
jgi:L-asparagine oxygenase